MRESARMEQYGLTSQDEDGIRLTAEGILLSNTVIAGFSTLLVERPGNAARFFLLYK